MFLKSIQQVCRYENQCQIVDSIFDCIPKQQKPTVLSRRKKSGKRHRVKRDRSLLAVTGPKYWPKWCHKVAFFRVFRQDFTLCLYTHRFKADPILSHSNPNIGTTIYGYKDKKYYQELGMYIAVDGSLYVSISTMALLQYG